jgi:hypothetical protein
MKKRIFLQIAIAMFIGIVLAVGINEISFMFLKTEAGRAPDRIELVIPAGTAEQVARGEPNPALPANMVFVIGDTLIVHNRDSETHSLGPLLIPPGASASMSLNTADNVAMDCSFQPGQYLGLDVREPVTYWTRLYGIFFAGIPLGGLLALYSFMIWTPKKAETV